MTRFGFRLIRYGISRSGSAKRPYKAAGFRNSIAYLKSPMAGRVAKIKSSNSRSVT